MRSDDCPKRSLIAVMMFMPPLMRAEDYSKPSKTGVYQKVSGIMAISYNPFLSGEAGGAYRNFEVAEKLTF